MEGLFLEGGYWVECRNKTVSVLVQKRLRTQASRGNKLTVFKAHRQQHICLETSFYSFIDPIIAPRTMSQNNNIQFETMKAKMGLTTHTCATPSYFQLPKHTTHVQAPGFAQETALNDTSPLPSLLVFRLMNP